MTEKDVRVAVIGAGLGGLAAARKLQEAGVDYALYEANPDRVGGRVWSETFENGQTAEHGAERIDTRHTHLLALAEEFGLELDDHLEGNELELPTIVRYLGKQRDEEEALADRQLIAGLLQTSTKGITYRQGDMAGTTDQAAIDFDALSVREWVQANVPGGASSPAAASLMADITELAGRDPNQVSAMALLDEWDTLVEYMTGDFKDPDNLADARYRVRGGNDLIPKGLLATLDADRVHMGARLVRLARDGDGYTLGFEGRDDVHVDAVVVAIPFAALRRVDTSAAGFSDIKQTIIRELEMGTVAKLMMQFNGRIADFAHWSGYFYNDAPAFTSIESTSRQEGDSMIMNAYLGGSAAATLPVGDAHAEAPASAVEAILDAIESAIPGVKERFTGFSVLDAWADDPYVHGAYSVFRPGQYTRFHGIIGDPEEGVFFAGEHTSKLHRGFMNGAVESGQLAAAGVIERLGLA